MTTLSIMQPYFFPYPNYFGMMALSDIFVVLDDVNFRKRSFLTRNLLKGQSGDFYFGRSVRNASQNRLIAQHEYLPFDLRVLTRISRECGSMPYYRDVDALLQDSQALLDKRVTTVNTDSLTAITNHFRNPPVIVFASSIKDDRAVATLNGKARILAICRYFGCERYLNLPGGEHLYGHDEFAREKISLQFVQTKSLDSRLRSPVDGYSILQGVMLLGLSRMAQVIEKTYRE